MKRKKLISIIVSLALCFSTIITGASASVYADGTATNVAKVGTTEYATITEAVSNWTNGATLTLLDNVTLEDTIVVKSTEHHILDLSTYTMTAASGKNAIEIKAYGTGDSERGALTINADSTNPGGINAGTKACIYYSYATTYTSGNDRPIIKITGGVFTGATSSWGTAGIYMKGTAARKCATLNISGGIFNCSINQASKGKLLISGGTFNYSVGSQGDSTAYRLISGGKFKSLGFMTADASNKFTVGSAMGTYDRYVYVDDNDYICIVPMTSNNYANSEDFVEYFEFEACVTGAYSKVSSYLTYSSAATKGVYYTDSNLAFADYNKTTSANKDIVFYNGAKIEQMNLETNLEVDLANGEVLPTEKVVLSDEDATFAISYKEGENPDDIVTVTSGLIMYPNVKSTDVAALADTDATIINRVYSLDVDSKLPVVAKISSTEYPSLSSAVEAAAAGKTITLMADTTENGLVIDKKITIDLNGYTYTIDGTVGSTGTATNGLQLLKDNNVTIKNGTITSSTAKILIQNYSNLTLDNVKLDGTLLQGTTPYTLSNNNGNIVIKNSNIIASANGVAFDVCDYSSYSGASVTVTDSVIRGKIEFADYNGGEVASKLISGANTYTTVGDYVQLGDDIVPINDYNFSLNVSDNAIKVNDVITVEVAIDKDYYSLGYTFTYDKTKFSCAQDTDNDGIIKNEFLTAGVAGVLEAYELTALNNIDKVTTTDISVTGNVIQYAEQALFDVVNVVKGQTEQVKISLDYAVEIKTDYVTGYSLLIIKGEDAGYAYNGVKTFYVTEYEGYAILVEGVIDVDGIDELLSKATDCKTIVKSNDVNADYIADGKIDLKDATAVYACYNLDFAVNEYMELFLKSDLNNDYRADIEDVNVIIANYN